MNIFSSQDRSLKAELFEMQNHLLHHPLCRVDVQMQQWNWVGRGEGGPKNFKQVPNCCKPATKLEMGASHPCATLSIHPASQPFSAIQCNAVSSISFDLLRFDSMYLSQSNANSVSFHFMSCHVISLQFNSIKCLHPTPAANWTSILHCTFQTFRPPVTSHAFPDASWALPQAPAKDG